MSKPLLKNTVVTLLTDEQSAIFSMAAECMGLKEATLLRQYAIRGLVQDQYMQHPMQKYADAAKKAG
jgi:hypothetical protein